MDLQEGICKLCLEKCANFESIDGNTKNALDLLLPKIDSAVVQESVICKDCAEILTNCFDFKVACLNTYDFIFSFINKNDTAKLDLIDDDVNKCVNGTDVADTQDVCIFCMGLVKKCVTGSVNVEEEDALLKKMIEQCLPELDLSVFTKPVICAPCHGSLENCFRFVTNYLIVQEKAKEYCETLDIGSKSQIELRSSLQFTMTDLAREVGGNLVNIMEVEKHLCEGEKNPDETDVGNGDDIIKLALMPFGVNEDISKDVKNKNESFMEMDDQEVNNEYQVAPNTMLVCEEENNKPGSFEEEEFVENNETQQQQYFKIEIQNFLLVETIDFKVDEHDSSSFEDGVALPNPEVISNFSGNPKCLTSNHGQALSESDIKQSSTDEDVSEKNHQCEYCSFRTKYKHHLEIHFLLEHNELSATYRCDSCSFQTKVNRLMENHLLLHKDLSEVIVYKCNYCSFQTKHETSVDGHLTVDPLIIAIYKCDSCSFPRNYKLCLKSPLLLHRDRLELTLLQCDSCSFQTENKDSFCRHLVGHKSPSKVSMYKCTSCSFQSRHLSSIKNHIKLNHTEEIKTYKCDSCSFQTKFIKSLRGHSLRHRTPSMRKCDSCSFQTKCTVTMTKHLLLHKDVTMFRCKLCPFQSKITYDTNRHMLTHTKNVPI